MLIRVQQFQRVIFIELSVTHLLIKVIGKFLTNPTHMPPWWSKLYEGVGLQANAPGDLQQVYAKPVGEKFPNIFLFSIKTRITSKAN